MNQPALLGLELEPTLAMRAGKQLIFQCAQCGLVAVQSNLSPGPLGPCPACTHRTWWSQTLPVAGLHSPSTTTEKTTTDPDIRELNAHVTDVASHLDFPVELDADMGGTFVLQIDLGTRGEVDDPNDRAGIDPTDAHNSFWWLDIEGGTKTIVSNLGIHDDPAEIAAWISIHARAENCPAVR